MRFEALADEEVLVELHYVRLAAGAQMDGRAWEVDGVQHSKTASNVSLGLAAVVVGNHARPDLDAVEGPDDKV